MRLRAPSCYIRDSQGANDQLRHRLETSIRLILLSHEGVATENKAEHRTICHIIIHSVVREVACFSSKAEPVSQGVCASLV